MKWQISRRRAGHVPPGHCMCHTVTYSEHPKLGRELGSGPVLEPWPGPGLSFRFSFYRFSQKTNWLKNSLILLPQLPFLSLPLIIVIDSNARTYEKDLNATLYRRT